MTDSELTEGLISRRREAINSLVHTYQPRIIKTACHFVADMQDAEDISQEVFIEVFRSIGRYRKGASLGTWITRITINRSLDHLRKQKRRTTIQRFGSFFSGRKEEDEGIEQEPAVNQRVHEEQESRKILDDAVGSLPESQRIAFILCKYEDHSYKEIAEIMNLSVPSVESLIHRAKVNLQKRLARYFSEYAKNKG